MRISADLCFLTRCSCLAGILVFLAVVPAWGQPVLFVSNENNTVGKYDAATGATINPTFVTGPAGSSAGGLTFDSNNHLFVGFNDGTVGEYNAVSGAVINSGFLPAGTGGKGMLVSGNRLFVGGVNRVGVYDVTTGAAINPNFITPPGNSNPFGLALDSNNHLFVVYGASSVGEYDATNGAVINANFITVPGLTTANARTIALDNNNHLFLSNPGNNLVGEYDATNGAVLNPNFISGQGAPWGLTLDTNNRLFVSDQNNSTIGEYNATTGAAINATFVNGQGLSNPIYTAYFAPVPEPSSLLLGTAAVGFGAGVRRRWKLTMRRWPR